MPPIRTYRLITIEEGRTYSGPDVQHFAIHECIHVAANPDSSDCPSRQGGGQIEAVRSRWSDEVGFAWPGGVLGGAAERCAKFAVFVLEGRHGLRDMVAAVGAPSLLQYSVATEA
ncbi:hypothetical protein AC579_2082 [Pseudocercospora musae]|uniref:Uncharacterized protein n=1 Tax=Pseudocercospora musae TaxID=113226 RepID=A0A139I528_9PEZI|nr:hypothetical protein AC579_2082 [Pseudocercospora musae]